LGFTVYVLTNRGAGRSQSMRIEYDPKHDLLNIEFISRESVAESIEMEGIIIDYAKDGRIIALEILDAGKCTTRDPLDLELIRK